MEPYINGIWRKINRNDGKILRDETDEDKKGNTLTHFTIDLLEGKGALLDIQGRKVSFAFKMYCIALYYFTCTHAKKDHNDILISFVH